MVRHHPRAKADQWFDLSQHGSTSAQCSTSFRLAKMSGRGRPRTRFPGADRLLLASTTLILRYSTFFTVRLRSQLGEVGESGVSGRLRRAYAPS